MEEKKIDRTRKSELFFLEFHLCLRIFFLIGLLIESRKTLRLYRVTGGRKNDRKELAKEKCSF
jgi:hypothetical protein